MSDLFILLFAQTVNDIGWIERAGIIGLMSLIVIAFSRRWVHTHGEFMEERIEKEFWRDLHLSTLQSANTAVHLARDLAEGNPEVRTTQ